MHGPLQNTYTFRSARTYLDGRGTEINRTRVAFLEDMIWEGVECTYENQGVGVKVLNNTEKPEVHNRTVELSIHASEALVLMFMQLIALYQHREIYGTLTLRGQIPEPLSLVPYSQWPDI
jgi:hypothetical protein